MIEYDDDNDRDSESNGSYPPPPEGVTRWIDLRDLDHDRDSESLQVDRCADCGTFVVMSSVERIRRHMNKHEIDVHGEIFPPRSIELDTDYR